MEAIEIDDARFMGRDQPARIEFSPRLNALVGGRGTGKSTVVHALRIAARREVDLANLKAESHAWNSIASSACRSTVETREVYSVALASPGP